MLRLTPDSQSATVMVRGAPCNRVSSAPLLPRVMPPKEPPAGLLARGCMCRSTPPLPRNEALPYLVPALAADPARTGLTARAVSRAREVSPVTTESEIPEGLRNIESVRSGLGQDFVSGFGGVNSIPEQIAVGIRARGPADDTKRQTRVRHVV